MSDASVALKSLSNSAVVCSCCGELKTLDHYRVIPKASSGRSSVCTACERKKRMETRRRRQLEGKEITAVVNGRRLTQVTKGYDSAGITDDRFCGIRTCELLAELEARGYRWDSMWLEKVEVVKVRVIR